MTRLTELINCFFCASLVLLMLPKEAHRSNREAQQKALQAAPILREAQEARKSNNFQNTQA